MSRSIVTAGDARDERARADAAEICRERAELKRDLERRLARACKRYTLYRGVLHRFARMKLARELRGLAGWRSEV